MERSTATVLIIAVALATGGLFLGAASEPSGIKVFHAGSLSKPFKRIDEKCDNFNLQRTSLGSREVMVRITELGKRPDVAAASDYSLIEDYLVGENLTDWYIRFARNEVVVAYSEDSSKYSGEINENNWYEIFARSDVRFAFGNPNMDPGGYRAMMAVQLAEEYYDNSEIFDDLIATNTAMTAPTLENGTYTIEAVSLGKLRPDTDRVKVGAKEVAVIPALKEGSVDYMFNYRSIAKQHDFKYVKLPDQINLSKVKYSGLYENVEVEFTDNNVKKGKPIVYGVTILEDAEHEEGAVEFLKYLFSENGRAVLKKKGQEPIWPPVTNDENKVPEELRGIVEEGQ